jgi:hypothetical protein
LRGVIVVRQGERAVPHEPQNVEEAVASLEHLAESQDRVTIGDMLDEFGERSFGPLLVIIALLDIFRSAAFRVCQRFWR